jgi:hypothetical protein
MGDITILARATLALYRDAARDASQALVRNVWVILLLPGYTIVLGLVGSVAGNLGFVGGFLMYLALAACVSSFLAVLATAVANDRFRPDELAQSFGRYLWSIVNVIFLLWIVQLLLGLIVQQNPGLVWLARAVNAGIFVLCNPLPELIYQSSRDGLAMIDEAVQFIRDNAVEWLLPMAVLLAPIFFISPQAGVLVMAELGPTSALALAMDAVSTFLPDLGRAGELVATLLASALVVWIMLFRGFLFRSLSRSGRRQRIFAARSRAA